jgi:hypothetical protein
VAAVVVQTMVAAQAQVVIELLLVFFVYQQQISQ